MSQYIVDIYKADREVERLQRAFRASLSRLETVTAQARCAGFPSSYEEAWDIAEAKVEGAVMDLSMARSLPNMARNSGAKRVIQIVNLLYNHERGRGVLGDETRAALEHEHQALLDLCTGWAEDE